MSHSVLLAATAATLASAATLAISAPDRPAAAAAPADVVLKQGDRVRVDGEPLGCRVATKDASTVLDCRRGGELAGSYGTMLSTRKAMVVRFRSNQEAKVVFTARHRGSAHRCR